MKIVDARCVRVALPLLAPIRTARTTLTERDVLIVRLEADDGTHGYGEVSSFTTDWYLPETLDGDEALMPALLEAVSGWDFSDPRDVDVVLRSVDGAQNMPAARAGVDCAVWDIFARQAQVSLARYCGFTPDKAAGGVVLPLGDAEKQVEHTAAAINGGYNRVKIKISNLGDSETLRAVRTDFPNIDIIADANGALSEHDFFSIAGDIDELGLVCIEEPVGRGEQESLHDFYGRIRAIQAQMQTPICLDESWVNESELRIAFDMGVAECYALKICKLGGITATLDVLNHAYENGISVWMGGMFDTGISKAVHAALSLHPANVVAGDISQTSRYFTRDICRPAFELRDGFLDLSRSGIGFSAPDLFRC